MSSYINFYLKVEDKYCPLGSYSRNCPEYQFLKDLVPYEKLAPLTIEKLNSAIEDIKFAIENERKGINNYLQNIEDIKTFNNSINEKMELIANYRDTLDELKEDLKANKNCLAFVYWLVGILTDIKYDPYADKHGIVPDNYLWAGVEASPEEEVDNNAE